MMIRIISSPTSSSSSLSPAQADQVLLLVHSHGSQRVWRVRRWARPRSLCSWRADGSCPEPGSSKGRAFGRRDRPREHTWLEVWAGLHSFRWWSPSCSWTYLVNWGCEMGDIVLDDHHQYAQERVLTRKTFNPCLEGNIAKGTTDPGVDYFDQ